ncbi:hypothetical protein Fot_06242 [Forsythia ovata]|uniref:Uncharacterized protein n=1 Tax=Forsythia ovata TaxID=205694 RepID=A0ABD1WVB5_9LAMI
MNIGSRKDELDLAFLEKLPIPSAIAVVSVHKYWTFTWVKATENANILELLKLAEISTSRSHVLNCKLYKVLAMKIDKQRSTVAGEEDIDELRSENKVFRSRFAVFEDARAQAEFKIIKSEMIQRLSISARKQAELKLKFCKDMAYEKLKQLTKALAELSKAKELQRCRNCSYL